MTNFSKIGIGSVQFGLPYGISNTTGQTHPDEVATILEFAFSKGIHIIDTASAYGNSEAVIGMLNVNRFLLVSKFMPPKEGETITSLLDKSLDLLKADSLYGYLAHRPLELLQAKNIWQELQELKSAGKIKKIGFSLNTPEEYHQLELAGFKPDLVQVPYNYFDNRFKDTLIKLKSEGCEVHTRSAFLQGLFFTETDKLSSFFDELKPTLLNLRENFNDQLQAALLNYVMQQDFIDVVIMGVENVDQLKANLQNLDSAPNLEPLNIPFSEELLMPVHWPKN